MVNVNSSVLYFYVVSYISHFQPRNVGAFAKYVATILMHTLYMYI